MQVVDLDALRELAWSGVPSDLRPTCWQLLLGYLPPNRERRFCSPPPACTLPLTKGSAYLPCGATHNNPIRQYPSLTLQSSMQGADTRQKAKGVQRHGAQLL